VFDNDHQPLDLKGKPEFRRWKDEGNARWAGDDPDMPKSFAHAGIAGQTAEAWLTYGHRLRPTHQPGPDQRHPPPQQPPGFDNDLRKLIANEMGYNSGQGDFNQDVTGEFWVGDLMLDCSVEVTQADGEFVLDLAKGPDRFQARFDVATGNCKLVRLTGTGQAEAPVLAENETKLKGTGTYHVRFANFDERLTVWVDGRLPFGDGVAYAPAKERGPVGPNDLQPARVGAVRAGVKVSHLQLWRDSYYTTTEVGTRVALNGDKDEPILTMYVQPGHFLALGDNSAASADSRSWGLVPQRLLLGRALVVYYPFWPFVSQTRAGLIR
jgi:signal peptidase I